MTTDSDKVLSVLRAMIEKHRQRQLRRHEKAGLRTDRQQALREALALTREKLIQMAGKFEREGEEELAEFNRELANLLDDAEMVRELGLR